MKRQPLVLVILLLLPVLAWGRTWRVEKDGTGDFTVIQAAVDAAASGDTVRIGPGRYEEYAPHEISGVMYNVYVYIDGKDITVLGAGENVTVVGYTEDMHTEVPIGIACYRGSVHLRDLAVSGANENVHVAYGETAITACTIRGAMFGVYPSVQGVCMIDSCIFVDNRFGVWHYSSAGHVVVQECVFTSNVNTSVGIEGQSSGGADVYNCRFTGLTYGVQYSFHANGRIEGCVFEDCGYTAVDITGSSMLEIVDCEMSGGQYNIDCDWAYFSGSGNILHGGTVAAIRCDHYASSLHESVIHNLPGGLLMKLAFFTNPPVTHLDFTHNDWGYDDPDSIAALIWDGNDDPSIYGVVDFEPYNTPGVANEDVS